MECFCYLLIQQTNKIKDDGTNKIKIKVKRLTKEGNFYFSREEKTIFPSFEIKIK